VLKIALVNEILDPENELEAGRVVKNHVFVRIFKEGRGELGTAEARDKLVLHNPSIN